MQEAKTHLDHLVEEAAAGDAFLICKAGKPMACVTPIDQDTSPKPLPRRLGLLEGQCSVPDDFDRLGSEASSDLFEGA
ncbi:type II toxin-antitoxin system Phd/YefM family antitoxin [Synechococcus sp. LA31]|uniref:type II toxin-antitoxin system Phd/YefM family antitoxin n=1 Tax=Synechococcus sp. LA31 TaxID=2741953 RepID=UPI001BDC42D5|nr:type II toxin-antitoxin system prevent-host-death family antitoxin [Synechococcus sp. LA31]QVV67058.1 type II toxin-antitoxin system prevent-host-death family antitoxin [Synechococcus sp. LA31]